VSSAPSLYRRHRPRTFADVVGQEHVVRTLRNAVEQGRVHHAYLFVGSRGTGKTSMAKILAACLNCERGPTTEPCGVCDSCVAIANASSLDVIEMDAASNNSVDDIRDLREKVAYAPVSGRHKVYILDEAHMLSAAAWNAFLKTLEEPPPNTIFVLATTEAQKVLPTVVDRCHRFDFQRPTVAEIAGVLRTVADAESIEISDEALALIARAATGSFRDALGTLEQLTTYSGASIALDDVLAVLGVADADLLFAVTAAVAAHDERRVLESVARLSQSGRDVGQFYRDLEGHLRQLLVVQTLGGIPESLSLTAEHDARVTEQAGEVDAADLVRALDNLAAALTAVKDGADARIQLELALIKAAAPRVDASTRALLARIEHLEARLARDGAPAAPAAPTPPPAPPPADPGPDPAGPVAAARTSESSQGTTATVTAVAAAVVEEHPAVEGDALISLWPAVLDALRSENPLVHAFVEKSDLALLEDGTLSVGFADVFSKKNLEKRENRDALGAALRTVTGRAVSLAFELREAAPAAAAPAVSEEELLGRLKHEFDAEEIPHHEDEGER
jgi:DNA polymerase III subunit gamma/tau